MTAMSRLTGLPLLLTKFAEWKWVEFLVARCNRDFLFLSPFLSA
jgi:hypothetical protein